MMETYAFADPASGKTKGALKKQRARQSIIVLSCDQLMRVFVRLAWAGRETPSSFRDRIVDAYGTFRPKRFGIEANAMQELFGRLVMEKCKEKWSTHQGMIPVDTPTRIEKAWKIRTVLQPLINEGRLFTMESHVELFAELQGFPTYHLRDLADCLAMCLMMVPRRFYLPNHGDDTELAALAEYLRNTGAPAAYITQRISELRVQSEEEHWAMLSGHARDRHDEERRGMLQ